MNGCRNWARGCRAAAGAAADRRGRDRTSSVRRTKWDLLGKWDLRLPKASGRWDRRRVVGTGRDSVVGARVDRANSVVGARVARADSAGRADVDRKVVVPRGRRLKKGPKRKAVLAALREDR